MEKSRHLLVALTRPVEGREDEFNEWYESKHVPECVQISGFRSGQRYKLTASRDGGPDQQYLALYELEGDDPQEILDALTSSSDRRTQSDAIDRSKTLLWVFSPIGEKHFDNESED